MNSIGNAHDDQGTLSGKGQAGVGSIETSSGSLLNLLDARTALTNDRADQDVGDQQTQGIGLRVAVGRLGKRLIVQRTDNKTECLGLLASELPRHRVATYLCDRINDTRDSENTLNSALLVVADGALGVRHLSDFGNVLAALSDNGGGLGAGNNGSHVDPSGLIVGLSRDGRLSAAAVAVLLGGLALGGIRDNSIALGVLTLRLVTLRLGAVGLGGGGGSSGASSLVGVVVAVFGSGSLNLLLSVLDDLVESEPLGLGLVVAGGRRGLLQGPLSGLGGLW